MELLQVLMNPRFGQEAESLVRRLKKLSARPAAVRDRPQPRRARFGSVERAVLSAVLAFDGPVTNRQVLREAERDLGTTFRPGSIKACLADLASRPNPPIRRVARGVYEAFDDR